MNAAVLAGLSLGVFLVALRVYGRYLSRRVLVLDAAAVTPAHARRDEVDYCPTRPVVLFGHHFASICGLGPIVGPAIAVIWGWLPAVLWVVGGVVLLGAVHDFGSLVLSLRYGGRSIGDITRELIGPRARVLFLCMTFFLIALAMGLFAYVIATLFSPAFYPEAVIPAFSLIGIAVVVGVLVHTGRVPLTPATLVGIVLMLGSIWLGIVAPIPVVGRAMWVAVLLVYAFAASSLPVWLLLQPRDYLNAFLLYAGLILMYVGIFVLRPAIVAPAINRSVDGLPPLFPFLFITVACGAISGFHALVSSGTTSKQVDREPDACAIGYGGMLAEGAMAMAVILACTAGVASAAAWHQHYGGWSEASGLGSSLGVFIEGAGVFISQVGVPVASARVFVSVVVVGFALTTLDSATRLLRYNIEEIGRTLGAPVLTNRFVACGIAVGAIAYFALAPAATTLWQLFGTTNQLLAALALLAVSLYLVRQRRSCLPYAVPMVLMLVITTTAMVVKIGEFWAARQWSLLCVGGAVLLLSCWLVVEAVVAYGQLRLARRGAIRMAQSARDVV